MRFETVTGYAPGRVNLIGEHTDYNGGMVLPAALPVGLEAVLTPRGDNRAVVTAAAFGNAPERSIDHAATGHWSDPAIGALREARALGLLSGGAAVQITSTIPHGAGLSSSAALIVAILKAARAYSKADITDTQIAVAARRVENEYIGVPCGIMDQMAVAHASAGEAIALDTRTLEFRPVTLPPDHSIMVVHSGITRNLNEGRYKLRKEECDAARAAFGQDALCLLAPSEIESKSSVPDIIRRRARHCATEHRRVLAAVEAIRCGDAALLGRLMLESHASMRDDFAISLPAIDALVVTALELGAVGARLTGGGFGGCIASCVANDLRGSWTRNLLQAHPDAQLVTAIGNAR